MASNEEERKEKEERKGREEREEKVEREEREEREERVKRDRRTVGEGQGCPSNNAGFLRESLRPCPEVLHVLF